MNIDDIAEVSQPTDPAIGLRAAVALRRLAERVEAASVVVAREQGWTWEQVGDALGVSRQSVHAKYRRQGR